VFNLFNHNAFVVSGANQDQYRVTYSASTGKYTITKYTNRIGSDNVYTFGQPGGYSSEVNPRQFQVAVKLNF
jgi:hypothetical protein